MWRPKNWKPLHPDCNDKCRNRVEDSYGLLCDWSCLKSSGNSLYEVGADAMLEALFELAKESPTGTFTIDSEIVTIFSSKETKVNE